MIKVYFRVLACLWWGKCDWKLFSKLSL